MISPALLEKVISQVRQHCRQAKGYEEGPWVNPLVPSNCVWALAMARALTQQEQFDRHVAIAPRGMSTATSLSRRSWSRSMARVRKKTGMRWCSKCPRSPSGLYVPADTSSSTRRRLVPRNNLIGSLARENVYTSYSRCLWFIRETLEQLPMRVLDPERPCVNLLQTVARPSFCSGRATHGALDSCSPVSLQCQSCEERE